MPVRYGKSWEFLYRMREAEAKDGVDLQLRYSKSRELLYRVRGEEALRKISACVENWRPYFGQPVFNRIDVKSLNS